MQSKAWVKAAELHVTDLWWSGHLWHLHFLLSSTEDGIIFQQVLFRIPSPSPPSSLFFHLLNFTATVESRTQLQMQTILLQIIFKIFEFTYTPQFEEQWGQVGVSHLFISHLTLSQTTCGSGTYLRDLFIKPASVKPFECASVPCCSL